MITLHNVTKQFENKKNNFNFSLSDICLTFPDNGMFFICGHSGSGKSTLLNLIGGLDKPTSGKILFNGLDITKLKERHLDIYRNQEIGFISQDYGLISEMNVLDNCLLALQLQSKDKKQNYDRVEEVLQKVGLKGYSKRKINDLSGGEKQRVAIARAITKESTVLLCDEPTGNLDFKCAKEIFKLLKELSDKMCIIIVTHNRFLAKRYADGIIDLCDGKIISDQTHFASSGEPKRDLTLKKRKHPSIKYILSLIKINISRSKILLFIILIVLIIAFSVLLASEYMANYNYNSSLASTLKDYKQYTLQVTDYYSSYTNEKEYGTIYFVNEITEKDIEHIELHPPNVCVAASYTFSKTFYDFFDEAIISPLKNCCTSFTNFVIIDDFNHYYQPIVYGAYPDEPDEILIFDYMAYNLLDNVDLSEVETIADLVEYQLIDKDTGFKMKISGILDSNCEDYVFADNNPHETLQQKTFRRSYLSDLRTIIGGTDFKKKLLNECFTNSYLSVEYVTEPMDNESEKSRNTIKGNEHKAYIISGVDELNMIYIKENADNCFLISDQIFSMLTGIDVDNLTSDVIEDMMSSAMFYILPTYTYHNPQNYYANDISSMGISIGGVYHTSEKNSIYLLDRNDEKLFSQIGVFQQPLILLTDEIDINADIIKNFTPQKYNELWWNDHKEYTETGYCIRTYFTVVLNSANDFLNTLSIITTRYYWLILSAILAALVAFAFYSVRHNKYNIGVLKTVGTPNYVLSIVYSTTIVVIATIGFLLSIGGAWAIISYVNHVFSDSINFTFHFYTFDIVATLKTILISSIVVLMAILCTCLYFLTRRPVSLIKNNDKLWKR